MLYPYDEHMVGRSRRRWEDNIRIDPKEIGTNTRNWTDLTQGMVIGKPL